MTKEELYSAFEYVNHTRDKRQQMASMVLENPEHMNSLMEIAFKVNDPISCKACWVLEYTAKTDLDYILPHINLFTKNIHRVSFDSSVRPMAKICEFLTKAYFSKSINLTKRILTNEHLEQIASACFDWLIGDHKVAAQAYSMTSLLLLGRTFVWIHPELKIILEQNYNSGSAAYKARARLTLEKIK